MFNIHIVNTVLTSLTQLYNPQTRFPNVPYSGSTASGIQQTSMYNVSTTVGVLNAGRVMYTL